jgi:aquaporin related protein
MLIGALPLSRGILLMPAQLVGAIAAAGIVSSLFPGPLAAGVSLGAGTSIVQGLFIEMFLTIELVFVIFMLAVEKSRSTYIAPLGIGVALFVTQLTGVYYTGAGVNPVRSFAPDVINGFTGYQWIYWIGPFLGSCVAAGVYLAFKKLGYETVNPGQDASPESVLVVYRDEEAALKGKNEVQHPSSKSSWQTSRMLLMMGSCSTRICAF